MLRLRHHPSKGDPRCFKTGKLTVHHQPFNKTTQSIFIILIQLSCFVSTNLNIFQNLFFFICRTIPENIFTSHSNHILICTSLLQSHVGYIFFAQKFNHAIQIQEESRESCQTHFTLHRSSSVSGSAPLARSSLGVLRLHSHPSQSIISLLTKLHINIHFPPTIILPYIN